VLAEDVHGQNGSITIYNDLDLDEMNNLSETQIDRNVGLFIMNAAQVNRLLKSVIVYGIGTGLFKRQSIVFLKLVEITLQHGKLRLIGPGEEFETKPNPYLTIGAEEILGEKCLKRLTKFYMRTFLKNLSVFFCSKSNAMAQRLRKLRWKPYRPIVFLALFNKKLI
ncbi:unnamed protein product, partial [Adineta ricciae]